MKSLIKIAVFIFSLSFAWPAVAQTKGLVQEPININTASPEQLMALPGVGPKIAQALIEGRMQRPYQSSADLAEVKGVGEKRLLQWEGLVTYGPLEPPSAGASSVGTKTSSTQMASKPGVVPAHP